MMKSTPILNIYQVQFLLHRFCYMDNLLIGKIKEYCEINNYDNNVVPIKELKKMLVLSKGLVFQRVTSHDFLYSIITQFNNLIAIEFIFDEKEIEFKNLALDNNTPVYQWKMKSIGLNFDADWKGDLFNLNVYDPNKHIHKTDISIFNVISDMLTDDQKYLLYYEKILVDNPFIYVELE